MVLPQEWCRLSIRYTGTITTHRQCTRRMNATFANADFVRDDTFHTALLRAMVGIVGFARLIGQAVTAVSILWINLSVKNPRFSQSFIYTAAKICVCAISKETFVEGGRFVLFGQVCLYPPTGRHIERRKNRGRRLVPETNRLCVLWRIVGYTNVLFHLKRF